VAKLTHTAQHTQGTLKHL